MRAAGGRPAHALKPGDLTLFNHLGQSSAQENPGD